jgi:hypothetical protein
MSQLPSGIGSSPPNYGQAYQLLQGSFAPAYGDLYNQYQASQSQGLAGLAASGLLGTTAAPSARMGYFNQYSQAVSRLAGQQAQEQIGLGQTYNQLALQGAGLGLQAQGLNQQQAAQNQSYGLAQQQMNQQNQQAASQQQNYYPGSLTPAMQGSFDSSVYNMMQQPGIFS